MTRSGADYSRLLFSGVVSRMAVTGCPWRQSAAMILSVSADVAYPVSDIPDLPSEKNDN